LSGEENYTYDVLIEYPTIIYDGIDLGPGEYPKIEGDHLYFLRYEKIVNDKITPEMVAGGVYEDYISNPVIMYDNKQLIYLKDYLSLDKYKDYTFEIMDYSEGNIIGCYNALDTNNDLDVKRMCFYNKSIIKDINTMTDGELFGKNYYYALDGGSVYYNGTKISGYNSAYSLHFCSNSQGRGDYCYIIFDNHIALSSGELSYYVDGKEHNYSEKCENRTYLECDNNAVSLINRCSSYYYENLETSKYGLNKYFDLSNSYQLPDLPDLQ